MSLRSMNAIERLKLESTENLPNKYYLELPRDNANVRNLIEYTEVVDCYGNQVLELRSLIIESGCNLTVSGVTGYRDKFTDSDLRTFLLTDTITFSYDSLKCINLNTGVPFVIKYTSIQDFYSRVIDNKMIFILRKIVDGVFVYFTYYPIEGKGNYYVGTHPTVSYKYLNKDCSNKHSIVTLDTELLCEIDNALTIMVPNINSKLLNISNEIDYFV